MERLYYSDMVERHNLSPMEKIMLSFDFVRIKKDNCYEMFKQLLASQNIKVFTYNLYGFRIKHPRSIIYVNDPKYNIDGLYFFDINWSLDLDDDEVNKYSYKYFAKTKDFFDEIDKATALDDYYIGYFANIFDEFYDLSFLGEYSEIPNDSIEIINNVSEIVDGKSLNLPYNEKTDSNDFSLEFHDNNNLDYDYINNCINRYDILLCKPIPGETMLEVLYNVSKAKYLEGMPCDFSLDSFKNIFYKSRWHFSEKSIYNKFRNNNYHDDTEKFLANVLDFENFDTISSTIDFYSDKNNLNNRIEDTKGKIKKI